LKPPYQLADNDTSLLFDSEKSKICAAEMLWLQGEERIKQGKGYIPFLNTCRAAID